MKLKTAKSKSRIPLHFIAAQSVNKMWIPTVPSEAMVKDIAIRAWMAGYRKAAKTKP